MGVAGRTPWLRIRGLPIAFGDAGRATGLRCGRWVAWLWFGRRSTRLGVGRLPTRFSVGRLPARFGVGRVVFGGDDGEAVVVEFHCVGVRLAGGVGEG